MYESARSEPGRFWRVRIGRKYFWIGFICLVAATAGLGIIWPRSVNGSFVFPWILLHAWRLHDFGRSGLWAVAVLTAVLFALSALAVVAMGSPQAGLLFGVVALVLLLLPLAFTLMIGLKPGDDGENRYGWPLGKRPPRPKLVDFS
jgi:uncharacterized membrane protein YhaH (DUF805 family)